MIESILFILLMLLLFLLRTGIDVIVFFTLMRVLAQARRVPKWIRSFDAVGGPLIDGPLRTLDRGLAQLTGSPWRREARLVVALLVLGLLRLSLI